MQTDDLASAIDRLKRENSDLRNAVIGPVHHVHVARR